MMMRRFRGLAGAGRWSVTRWGAGDAGGCGGGIATFHTSPSSPADGEVPISPFRVLRDADSTVEVRAWVHGVELERTAEEQLLRLSHLPPDILQHPVAVMPDVHSGIGSTVGTVIPTTGALIPASVGVDIGCGMLAVKTSVTMEDVGNSSEALRLAIEVGVPHGRTHGGKSSADAGGWCGSVPDNVARAWKKELAGGFEELCKREPSLAKSNNVGHLGTLGTGNHFIELCVDEHETTPHVWVMLHSGSRGVGNRIGSHYIDLAQRDMGNLVHQLPSTDLAYLREGTEHFNEYVAAVEWAQKYAHVSRQLMLEAVLSAMRTVLGKPVNATTTVVNCHHNYVERLIIDAENSMCYGSEEGGGGGGISASSPSFQSHLGRGQCVWLTRKGATAAYAGTRAVIPGSMGARSYIVKGKGNPQSYCSCSHGAGRRYSRGEAKRRFTLQDHEAATNGVECRKDADVLDETPAAYKDIDAVMVAQNGLVEVEAVLKQFLCVKG